MDHKVFGLNTQAHGGIAVQGVGKEYPTWIGNPSTQRGDFGMIGINQLRPEAISTSPEGSNVAVCDARLTLRFPVELNVSVAGNGAG